MTRGLFVVLLAAVLMPKWSPAAQQVNLQQAQQLALERNLNLKAADFDARASEALVRKGYGIYDPVAEASFTEGESRELSAYPFLTTYVMRKTVTESRTFDLSLGQLLPTGGELVAGLDNDRTRIAAGPSPTINPAWRSQAHLSLVQPLLKGFGRTVTEQQILYAVRDRQMAVQELRAQAFTLLTRVRDGYYDILRNRDNLKYRETSVALAEKILAENRARVDAGVLPPIEILEAEVGLTQRERELLDAQRAYRDALDHLAVLLNLPEGIEVADEELLATELSVNEEVGYQSALARRPELQQRQRQIEKLELERTVNRNQLLPGLDLNAGYGRNGLGENYGDDLGSVSDDDLNDWSVGLALSYPLGNRAARNELRKTELRMNGERARLRQLHEEVRNEIRAAARLIDVNRKKIDVADRGRELAEEKLRTLLKRKEVGLATTRDVLEGEEDLALARTDQIASLADYNRAVTDYLRVTGLLLETQGIHLVGLPDPDREAPLLEMQNP